MLFKVCSALAKICDRLNNICRRFPPSCRHKTAARMPANNKAHTRCWLSDRFNISGSPATWIFLETGLTTSV